MKIILASKSAARQNMLKQCGLNFQAIPADIDESAIITEEKSKDKAANEIALTLSLEKAKTVSEENPHSYVIGSDQILEFEDELFEKATSIEETKEKLLRLSGKTHSLYSAYSVLKNNEIIDQYCDRAALTMHKFNEDFVDLYIKKASNDVTQCVGGYAVEGIGITLFEKIDGDYYTILGMPLLPLLATLRAEGVLS